MRSGQAQGAINSWLIQHQDLTPREAYEARQWANNYVEQNPNDSPLEAAWREKDAAEEEARREAARTRYKDVVRHPAYSRDEAHPEEACVTCGDPSFYCSCTCKRFSDIPF